MASAPKANAVVGQSGGPTAVINASLVGVVEEAKKHPEIQSIYGAIHAVAGMVKDEFIDLGKLSAETLETVAVSPSSALGSSRDKPDAAYCRRILETFKKRNVKYFFYIGGNDSANTAYILNTVADESGFDIRAFHVPKTVDNDLLVTDHCPGYGSAAKFVACALMGDDLDNRALPGVKIDVIMGRHAGFLTAAAALGRQRDDDGPHLLYFPERPVSIGKVLADVEAVYKKHGRAVIAVSEGMCDADGETWAKKIAQNAEKDQHGNIQLSGTGALADFLAAQVKNNLNIKRIRADTFGYLQRSGEEQPQHQANPRGHVRLPAAELPGIPVDRRCGRSPALRPRGGQVRAATRQRLGGHETDRRRPALRRRTLPHRAQERGGKDQVDARRIHQRRRQRRHGGVPPVCSAPGRPTAPDRVPGRLPESLSPALIPRPRPCPSPRPGRGLSVAPPSSLPAACRPPTGRDRHAVQPSGHSLSDLRVSYSGCARM
ncbi:MAG: diphosphate--fructose-6-phosphate 1-phosphotransferase [Planctomycetes bacterium]|nr:diphosphate--fructose-6-phosphate 1-phosphotransferase [Planctomycetota bacterium]